MQNAPVNWYEGLFLRPHHFQAADRYWAETLRASEQWDHPYNYGLLAIDFSREALGNQQFEVRLLKARMRDGTLVALEHGQEPDRVGLSEAFDKKEVVTVYLGVPKLKLGRPNVGNQRRRHAGPLCARPAWACPMNRPAATSRSWS